MRGLHLQTNVDFLSQVQYNGIKLVNQPTINWLEKDNRHRSKLCWITGIFHYYRHYEMDGRHEKN